MNLYRPGKLGTAEGIALVFGMVMSRMFVSSIAVEINEAGQLLWLTIVIDTMVSLLCLFMLVYVSEHVPGNLFVVCKQLVGVTGAWLILLSYSGMYFANSAMLLRQYAEYTLLTALPYVEFQLVVLWYAVTAGILCYLGIEGISRAGYILLPLLVGAPILIFMMLSPFYVVYHLAPWQGNGMMTAVQAGMSDGGYNLGVLALVIMAAAFQNANTIKRAAIYSLGGAAVLKVCFILVYMMVFGTIVGSEKSMPFFEMARLVYLNHYIQRIEALFIVVWVFFGLLAVAGSLYIGLYLITMLCKLPAIRPIVPLGFIIIANLAMIPPDIGTALVVDAMLLKVFNVGMYAFPIALFIMASVQKRRKKSCAHL